MARATSPIKCIPGTFASTSGQSRCTDCPAGKFQSVSGATACVACPVGSFCEAAVSTPTPCAPGTFRSQPNGKMQYDPCSVGSLYEIAGDGNFSLLAEVLTNCSLGNYSLQQLRPTHRSLSIYSLGNNSLGNYSLDDHSRDHGCSKCPRGFSCSAGATRPIPCAPGSHTAQRGQSRCDFCEGGKFQQFTAATGCEICPKGGLCMEGSSGPRLCVSNLCQLMSQLSRCLCSHPDLPAALI